MSRGYGDRDGYGGGGGGREPRTYVDRPSGGAGGGSGGSYRDSYDGYGKIVVHSEMRDTSVMRSRAVQFILKAHY
jgi:hypothetical protein